MGRPKLQGRFRRSHSADEFGSGTTEVHNGRRISTNVSSRCEAQNGRTVYLGLSDRGAKHLLHTLARRFLALWCGMFLLGFVISYWRARRTLHRVERITE